MQGKFKLLIAIGMVCGFLSIISAQEAPLTYRFMEKVCRWAGLGCPSLWRIIPYVSRYDFLRSLSVDERALVDHAILMRIDSAIKCEQRLYDLIESPKADATDITYAQYRLRDEIALLDTLIGAYGCDCVFFKLYDDILLYRAEHKNDKEDKKEKDCPKVLVIIICGIVFHIIGMNIWSK